MSYFFQLHLMLHAYVQRFDMMIIGKLAIFFCFWIKKLVLTALYSRGTNAPSKNKKRKEREKNKLCRRWCSKPASHPLPVEIRSPMFPFFGLDSIGSRVSGKEPSTLACSASDSKPYFSLRACSASQVTSSHQPLRMPAYYEKFRYLTSNTHASHFDIKFACLLKYDIERANSFEMGDFGSFSKFCEFH